VVTSAWKDKTDEKLLHEADELIIVDERELKKISQLKTSPGALAVVEIENQPRDIKSIAGNLTIGLEDIQDPGNLGTIIRIAAWFGIDTIVCSENTVDVYNPKVLQASMGAILHVKVIYTDLAALLPEMIEDKIPVFATTLDGVPVQSIKKTDTGMLLFGNESRGLSKELIAYATHRIMIPSHRKISPGIESLNVAASAAVICNEFRKET